MLSLHPQQMLPGITINQQMLAGVASLSLPLPGPSFPWNEHHAVATSLSTTAAPEQQPGCWALMPPAASSVPSPSSSLAPAAHTAGSQITWQPKAPAHGLASAHTFATAHNLAPAHTLAAPSMRHAAGMPSHDGNTLLLSSMLQQLQDQQQRSNAQFLLQQKQQQQDWSAALLRRQQMHGMNSSEAPAAMQQQFFPPQMQSHESLDTSCSSRSSNSSTTAGAASRGSPSNSLSTLLACNERLKSQLHENELRIQQCQDSAKSTSADGDTNSNADSNEGTDDDSSNGASGTSNASTTPGHSAVKPGPTEGATGQSRYWSEDEHRKFLEAVRCFGAHNHKAIASYVTTRNSTQVRSHSQKFFKKLETFSGRGLPTMLRKRKTLDAK